MINYVYNELVVVCVNEDLQCISDELVDEL